MNQNTSLPIEQVDGKKLLSGSYSRQLIDKMKERAKERRLSNKTIMDATGISQSTFYRCWNSDLPDPPLELDNALRLCLFLGLSIDDLLRPTTATSPANLPISEVTHDEVMGNVAELLSKRKARIDELESERSHLSAQIEHKNHTISALNDELQALHNRIHDLNREHAERLDRLYAELSQRNQQLLDLLQK